MAGGLSNSKDGDFPPLQQPKTNIQPLMVGLNQIKIPLLNTPKSPTTKILAPPTQTTNSIPNLEGSIAKAFQEQSLEVSVTPHIVLPSSIKARLLSKVKYVLIAKFSHGKPSYKEFRSFLNRLNLKGSCIVSLFDPKHVFLNFECFEDFASLWMRKVCIINGFKARLFNWWEGFNPAVESRLAPVWIQLYGLPIFLMEEEVIIQIASSLGKLLMIDPRNLTKSKVDCLNVCVAVDVSCPSPTEIVIDFVENGKIRDTYKQKVQYENKPSYCLNCCHLGHQDGMCLKLQVSGKGEGVDKMQIELGSQRDDAASFIKPGTRKQTSHRRLATEPTAGLEKSAATDSAAATEVSTPVNPQQSVPLQVNSAATFENALNVPHSAEVQFNIVQLNRMEKPETVAISEADSLHSPAVRETNVEAHLIETAAISHEKEQIDVLHQYVIECVAHNEDASHAEVCLEEVLLEDPSDDEVEEGEICLDDGRNTKGDLQQILAATQVDATEIPMTSSQVIPQGIEEPLQEFIHTCEALHVGRTMIEETKLSNENKESNVGIDQSAIPYTKKMIETKVNEHWKEQMNKVTKGAAFELPAPKQMDEPILPRSNDLETSSVTPATPVAPTAVKEPEANTYEGESLDLLVQQVIERMALPTEIVESHDKDIPSLIRPALRHLPKYFGESEELLQQVTKMCRDTVTTSAKKRQKEKIKDKEYSPPNKWGDKDDIEEEMDSDTSHGEKEENVPKKRGRPPKQVQKPTEPAPMPKPKGRPKKK